MNLIRTRPVLLLLLVGWGLFLSACRGGGTPPTVVPGVDRSDPTAVAQASFRAIMAKDYPELVQLLVERNGPDDEEWANGAFMRDYTPGEKLKVLWRQGPIRGATVGEPRFEDYQGPRNSQAEPYRYQIPAHASFSGRVVQIPFVVSGQSFVATFPMMVRGNQWSVGMNPQAGDFFIRFEAVGE